MYLLINGIFTLSYLATAVIVGFGVHHGGVVTDQAAAIAVGASILLLGILLHQGFARSRRDQSLVSALVTVEQA